MLTGNVDVRREPIYDTLVVTKQTTVPTGQKFFTSGTDSGKTLNQTNLGASGEFPPPERMDVMSIRVLFGDTPKADIIGICKAMVGRLVVSGKTAFTAPLMYTPGGAGLNTADLNGISDATAIMQFPDGYQIPIETGEKWYFELVGAPYLLTDTSTGLYMQVWLDGLHSVAA